MQQDLKDFKDLTTTDLYRLLQLRAEVFVVEQECAFQDMDNKDFKSSHLLIWDNDVLAAYCRLLPPGISYSDAASIGRIVTSPKHRSTGLGKTLLTKAIQIVKNKYPGATVKIGAQYRLEKWYGQFGFKQSSEIYDEDGIDHIEMTLH